MIILKLNDLLEKRGLTLYWLSKQSGVRYATIWNLSKENFSALRIDMLDRICAALKCQPGDLLVRVEESKGKKRAKRR